LNPNSGTIPKQKPAPSSSIKQNLRSLNSDFFLVEHPILTLENCHSLLGSLPYILNAFERACLLQDVNKQYFSEVGRGSLICPEFLLWAISGSGLSQPRRSYEVLETYGDTMLKLAATLCAYRVYKNDAAAGEGEVENLKVLFVTNYNTYRVGYY
jgi:hypothetical protein